MVFVLIPGGTFKMGSLPISEANPEGADYVDPLAEWNEFPLNQVTLDPFLLSKFEMTQGQWLRVTGHNPSLYKPGVTQTGGGKEADLRHPVEMVSWNDCDRVTRRLDLVIPTEAQWEYACRAGTSTPWYTGRDSLSLEGYANIGDLGAKTNFSKGTYLEEGFIDGYVITAPVGSFLPNPFGLHDMIGNVSEWCRDRWPRYLDPVIAGDGARDLWRINWSSEFRVHRGGTFRNVWRSAQHDGQLPIYRSEQYGLRPAVSIMQEDSKEVGKDSIPPEEETRLQESWEEADRLMIQEEYQDVEPLYRQLLEEYIQYLGEDHWKSIKLGESVAIVLTNLGKDSEVERVYRRFLAVSVRVFGEEHLRTHAFQFFLARALNRQGKHTEAESLFRQAYNGYLIWMGEDNPFTPEVLRHLTIAVQKQGKYARAEPLYRKLLEMQVRVLESEDHPDTRWTRRLVGWALIHLGRYEEAEPLFRHNLKISEKLYDDEDQDRLRSMSNLAMTLMEQGRLSEARALVDPAVEIADRTAGGEDKLTLEAMEVLADVLKKQGDLSEAEKLHAHILETRRRVLGDEHRHTIRSQRGLALVLMEREKFAEAEKLMREAIRVAEKIFYEESMDRLSIYKDYGRLLIAVEKYDEAEERLTLALEGYKKELGEDHAFTQEVLQLLEQIPQR
jgi:formylglycine-generating enzyme required for sulfatase activity/tetratricopeptide (TPR) repeat protein